MPDGAGRPRGRRAAVRAAENAFNTAELIGLELSEATATAGEHGCEIIVSIADAEEPDDAPVLIASEPELARDRIAATEVRDLLLELAGAAGGRGAAPRLASRLR